MTTEADRRAAQRAEAKSTFYVHLLVYLVFNFLRFAIYSKTSTTYFWFSWPLIGWGIGVCVHAMTVFAWGGAHDETEP